MRRTWLAWAVLLCVPALAHAAPARLGLGGGGWVQALWLDVAALNADVPAEFAGALRWDGRAAFLLSGAWAFGGEALRVGAANGRARWSGGARAPWAAAELGLELDALWLEGTLPARAWEGSAWSLGGLVGWGTWRLELRAAGDAAGGWPPPADRTALAREALVVQPFVSLEGAFGVLGVKGVAGVLGAFALGPWRLAGGRTLTGGPLALAWAPVLGVMISIGV